MDDLANTLSTRPVILTQLDFIPDGMLFEVTEEEVRQVRQRSVPSGQGGVAIALALARPRPAGRAAVAVVRQRAAAVAACCSGRGAWHVPFQVTEWGCAALPGPLQPPHSHNKNRGNGRNRPILFGSLSFSIK